jgi:hypothetical protein
MLWDATQRLAEGINRIPGLQLVATPTTGVLVFGSATLDIARLAQQMESKGWSGRPQADPPSIRLLLAPYHRQIVDAFLQDLASAAASTRTGAIAMPATAA